MEFRTNCLVFPLRFKLELEMIVPDSHVDMQQRGQWRMDVVPWLRILGLPLTNWDALATLELGVLVHSNGLFSIITPTRYDLVPDCVSSVPAGQEG